MGALFPTSTRLFSATSLTTSLNCGSVFLGVLHDEEVKPASSFYERETTRERSEKICGAVNKDTVKKKLTFVDPSVAISDVVLEWNNVLT